VKLYKITMANLHMLIWIC